MPWTYIINDLKGRELVETFYGKEFKKIEKQIKSESNQIEFRIQKVMKKKGDRLYVK